MSKLKEGFIEHIMWLVKQGDLSIDVCENDLADWLIDNEYLWDTINTLCKDWYAEEKRWEENDEAARIAAINAERDTRVGYWLT